MTCASEGKSVLYIGESGLSGFERCNQHYNDAKNKPEKSHINIHRKEDHQDMDPGDVKFKFKILRRMKTPFQRQISEAIAIRLRTRKGKETLLNNKQEFSRCVLPELEVTMKDKIISNNISEETNKAVTERDLEAEAEETIADRKRPRNIEERMKNPNNRRKKEVKKITDYMVSSTDIRFRPKQDAFAGVTSVDGYGTNNNEQG